MKMFFVYSLWLFSLIIFQPATTFSQPKLDVEQNERLNQLEKELRDLKKENRKLKNNQSDSTASNEASGSNSELSKIEQELENNRMQLKALQKAIREGLDKNLVKDQVAQLEKAITSLDSKKFTILNTKISNQKLGEASVDKLISLQGLLEVEASHLESYARAYTSKMEIATLELAAEISLSDFIKGNILIEKEDAPNNKFDMTEAFLSYGNSNDNIISFKIGKLTIPFGKFETSLLSDSLGSSIGETAEDAAMVLGQWQKFYLSTYIFKGATKETGRDDRIRQTGAELGYLHESDEYALHLAVGYLSNFADTDLIATKVTDTTLETEDVSGQSFSLIARYQPFTFIAEYITASERFNSLDLAYNTQGAKPQAMQWEASYTAGWKYETTFSLGYQTTDEAVGLELPETRTLVGTNTIINEHSSIGFEFHRDQDYKTTECNGSTCGTGKKARSYVANFALTF